MVLATPRLRLRDFEPRDAEAMLRIEGDPEAVRWQSYAPRTLESCRAYIERDLGSRIGDRSCFDLAIALADDGRYVGRVGLDIKLPERSVGELWFILERALWGRGLVPEAARRLVDFGFEDKGLHRIFLECDPRNPGAIRVAEKLGMEREAHLRENVRIKGEWCDSLIFAVLRRPSR
jgi:RimJ/RimL family protein N-acetyltransferase